jgi:REP element-mobilizing transposase RayT
MSNFNKLTHTIFECKYHVVFCPRYRFKIFKDEIVEYSRREFFYSPHEVALYMVRAWKFLLKAVKKTRKLYPTMSI